MLCSLLTAGVYQQWDGGSGGSGVTVPLQMAALRTGQNQLLRLPTAASAGSGSTGLQLVPVNQPAKLLPAVVCLSELVSELLCSLLLGPRRTAAPSHPSDRI